MTTGATMTEYTAPEGATHQSFDTPHLFYRPGANGFIEARWAANRLPNDVWTSGHGRNELLSVASVYRPITPTWRDGAPPEVESKPKEYAPGVWHPAPDNCPVPDATLGFVRFQCGTISSAPASRLGAWAWGGKGDMCIAAFFIGTESEARAALESKPAEGPRFTPRFGRPLPQEAVFLGQEDEPKQMGGMRRDFYFVPPASFRVIWGDGSGADTYELDGLRRPWLRDIARRLAIKRGLWSPPEASEAAIVSKACQSALQRSVKFIDEDPQCRTPKDIEGEPAALARIEAMPHSMPFFSDAALAEMELRHRKAEAARSLLIVAPRDHRLGHWGANTGDE